MTFDLDEGIRIANQAVVKKFKRNLTDVQVMVLKGSWQRFDYDQIAAQNQYSPTYISQDVAPKLWKLLGDALGERVKKANFKEALKRHWETQQTMPPPPVAPSEDEGESDFYVKRPPTETICYEALLQAGALVRLKAPSLMGKTTLMLRVLEDLGRHGYQTVHFSLELADRQTHLTDLNRFLSWFCHNLARELRLEDCLNEYWDEEGMGAKVSCTTYFEEYLLPEIENPLVLCLDDVDLLFPHPHIYEDFFGLLRSWHEKARSRRRWQQLRLAIVHATDVYIQLNINQSPFNVGLPIELSEFTPEQVLALAGNHGLTPERPQIGDRGFAPLTNMVGGHPFLLEQAFAYLKTHPDITLDRLLADATTDRGIYGHHLRDHWMNLQHDSQLAAAFKRVIGSSTPVLLEPICAYQLQSRGLVKMAAGGVEPRCNLYRDYFSKLLSEFG